MRNSAIGVARGRAEHRLHLGLIEEPNCVGLLHARAAHFSGWVGVTPAPIEAVVEHLAEQCDRVVDQFRAGTAAPHGRNHPLDVAGSDACESSVGEMALEMGARKRAVRSDGRRLQPVGLQVLDEPLGPLGHGQTFSERCRPLGVHTSAQLTLGLGFREPVAGARLAHGAQLAFHASFTHPPLPVPAAGLGEEGTAAVGTPRGHSLRWWCGTRGVGVDPRRPADRREPSFAHCGRQARPPGSPSVLARRTHRAPPGTCLAAGQMSVSSIVSSQSRIARRRYRRYRPRVIVGIRRRRDWA